MQTLLLSILLFISPNTTSAPVCDEISIAEEVEQRKIIVMGKLVEDTELYDKYIFKISKYFKGVSDEILVLSKGSITIKPGYEYILFIDGYNSKTYNIDPCSKSGQVNLISVDIIKYLQNLPCYVAVQPLKEMQDNGLKPTGACTYELAPVCGCDGVTYGNSCEMEKKGIMKHTPGKCPE